MTVASGSTASVSMRMASAGSSTSPPLETITGSTTSAGSWPEARSGPSASATVRAMAAVPSMPSLALSMRTSSNSVSICSRMKSVETPSMPVTARVFWAVSAQMTAQP